MCLYTSEVMLHGAQAQHYSMGLIYTITSNIPVAYHKNSHAHYIKFNKKKSVYLTNLI
jgi:hypothetical protein